MTALSVVAALMLAFGGTAVAVSSDGPQMADGAALFTANKCDKCHSVDAAKIPCLKPDKNKGDLSKVTTDADTLTKYLKKEIEGGKKNKKHKKGWKGSDADLAKLVSWLRGAK